jgi:hypothetical protein
MIANANGLVKVLERKGGILSAQPARFTPLRQAAESLSRANIHRAHCEILNEAITRCTVMLYERDNTGRWVNIDRSGQALIALPWGRAGQREWGLRRSEADALRALLFAWQQRHDKRRESALYLYGASERRWWLNLADYADEASGLGWVRSHPVTVAQWRAYSGSE